MDLVLGSALLIVLSPLMALIALAIRLDSPGPVFYRQTRVGGRLNSDGRWEPFEFRMVKFRSMFNGVDETRHRQYIEAFVTGTVEPERQGPAFKLSRDDRVTRVGRWIRRTSLDELPQLFNVLAGDMSLVGPRPVPVYEVDAYSSADLERFSAVSGITGLWQVRGRGRVTFEQMIAMDVEYARTRSFWLDVKLLIATVPAAVSGRGAG